MFAKLPFATRIALAFVLMTTLVSGAFSLGVFSVVHFVEEHLVSEELSEELRIVLEEDLRAGRAPRLDSRTRFFASDSDEFPLPPWLADLSEGFTEVVNGNEAVYVFLHEKNGARYALVQEQSEFETRERILFNVTLAGFFLCIAAAWALARHMAARVMAPVTSLADKVRRIDLAAPQTPLLTPDYADDEIGRLATAFDTAFGQLRLALERERFFTSDVSHELRTPLMIVSSSCELLRESDLNEAQEKLTGRIDHAATEMRDLVETFLLLARNKQGQGRAHADCTLAEAAQEQTERWAPRIREKGIHFVLETEGADSGQYNRTFLCTVMSNLLRNALHYTERGHICLVLECGGFRVEDSGVGIPAAEREQMFAAFVRGPQARGEGLGLGLSLVKRICEHQGWSIEALETGAGGSTFTVHWSQGPQL